MDGKLRDAWCALSFTSENFRVTTSASPLSSCLGAPTGQNVSVILSLQGSHSSVGVKKRVNG
jgi:hypothetical protein